MESTSTDFRDVCPMASEVEPTSSPSVSMGKAWSEALPFALRCYLACQRGLVVSKKSVGWSILIGIIISYLIGALFPSVRGTRIDEYAMVATLWVAAAGVVCYLLLMLARAAILAFFIARFSLGQFMVTLFVTGLLVSLLVELQGAWKVFPAGALLLFLGVVMIYLKSYDPFERDKLLPPAARETLFNPPDAPKPKLPACLKNDAQMSA